MYFSMDWKLLFEKFPLLYQIAFIAIHLFVNLCFFYSRSLVMTRTTHLFLYFFMPDHFLWPPTFFCIFSCQMTFYDHPPPICQRQRLFSCWWFSSMVIWPENSVSSKVRFSSTVIWPENSFSSNVWFSSTAIWPENSFSSKVWIFCTYFETLLFDAQYADTFFGSLYSDD